MLSLSNGLTVEKFLLDVEARSRIPCNLWLPEKKHDRLPGLVLTCGHGGSKSAGDYQYIAHLYARLGFACLVADPVGEEERNSHGLAGSREHDLPESIRGCNERGRPVLGKMVFDASRCLEYLAADPRMNHERLAVAGYSLGGAVASYLAAVDGRPAATIVAGWALDDELLTAGKDCTRLPCREFRIDNAWSDIIRLIAAKGKLLFANGDSDEIIDQSGTGAVWENLRTQVDQLARGENLCVETVWWRGGGHRPYHGSRECVLWLAGALGALDCVKPLLNKMPDLSFGEWADDHGVRMDKLYDTEHHLRGMRFPDTGFTPFAASKLACLRKDEIGAPDFTIKGWLDACAWL